MLVFHLAFERECIPFLTYAFQPAAVCLRGLGHSMPRYFLLRGVGEEESF